MSRPHTRADSVEHEELGGCTFSAALARDKAEEATSPLHLPASRRASLASARPLRTSSHLRPTTSGRPDLPHGDMDAVEQMITQRRLQVNTEAMAALPFGGAAADIMLNSTSSHVPPCWLRNTVKRTRHRRHLSLLGHARGDCFALSDAWERCLYRSRPGPQGLKSHLILQPHYDTPGTGGQEACIAMLQANRAQNVFMLVVPVVSGARTFSPGEDPVVAAIAFARFADGQRHVVVLLPGSAEKQQHADLGGADEVEQLLHMALNRQSLPLGVAVLRSRDAACMEDIDGDTVKALDFGGRVTVASTKNLQLQRERGTKAPWPGLKVQPETRRWSSPISSVATPTPCEAPLSLQCGRIGRDDFACDHNDNAMSGLQAFAIALAVFTWRPQYMWL